MKSNFSTPGFLWPLLTLICLILLLAGLHAALKKEGWESIRKGKIFFGTVICIAAWVTALVVLSQKGFFASLNTLPPRPVLAILLPLPVVLIIAFSKTGTTLINLVPTQWFLFFQSFRIFVGLLIWLLFLLTSCLFK